MRKPLEITAFILFMFVMGISGYLYESRIACPNRALMQGLSGEYFLLGNSCIFTLPDGTKVNEKNYRVI